MKKISQKMSDLLKKSFKEAHNFNDVKIRPEHFILSLIEDQNNNVTEVLNYLDVDGQLLIQEIEYTIRTKISNNVKKNKILPLSEELKIILSTSELESDKLSDKKITEDHVFLTILKDKNLEITKFLNNSGITYGNFKESLVSLRNKNEINMSTHDYEDGDEMTPKTKNKSNGKSNTPILDNFGKDITKLASEGTIDPIIGRDDEVERVSQILSRRKKNNPILIGEPGCVDSDTLITVRKISTQGQHNVVLS